MLFVLRGGLQVPKQYVAGILLVSIMQAATARHPTAFRKAPFAKEPFCKCTCFFKYRNGVWFTIDPSRTHVVSATYNSQQITCTLSIKVLVQHNAASEMDIHMATTSGMTLQCEAGRLHKFGLCLHQRATAKSDRKHVR